MNIVFCRCQGGSLSESSHALKIQFILHDTPRVHGLCPPALVIFMYVES